MRQLIHDGNRSRLRPFAMPLCRLCLTDHALGDASCPGATAPTRVDMALGRAVVAELAVGIVAPAPKFGVLSDSTHHQVCDREAVVEIYFDNFPDMLRTLEPATPSAASQDGKFFADESTNIIVMAEEEEIPVPNPQPSFNPGLGIVKSVGAFKVLQYIMRDDEVFREDYYRRWRAAHEDAMAKAPYAREQMRRCVANKRCRINDNDGAARKHFRMVDPPVYDMVVSMWFDTAEQAGAFRQSPCHSLAHRGKPGVGHVGVTARPVLRHHTPQGRDHGLRRLDIRIAQREIENVLRSALPAQANAFFEHAPYPRRMLHLILNGFGDAHTCIRR